MTLCSSHICAHRQSVRADAFSNISCIAISVFQAKFKLTLEVPSELTALSNMPVANTTVAGPIKTIRYQESPLMSTYLVAIVVGLFEYVEGVTVKGTSSVSLITLTLSIQIVAGVIFIPLFILFVCLILFRHES
jgi:aminopeptidase N